jgi:NIPSNAP
MVSSGFEMLNCLCLFSINQRNILGKELLMAVQLRIYTINRGALNHWATEWREMIKPLREKLGFKILGAWTIEETNQFVWLLSYDGPSSWATLDKAFHQSDERREMKPDPARNIARVEQYFINPVE